MSLHLESSPIVPDIQEVPSKQLFEKKKKSVFHGGISAPCLAVALVYTLVCATGSKSC